MPKTNFDQWPVPPVFALPPHACVRPMGKNVWEKNVCDIDYNLGQK